MSWKYSSGTEGYGIAGKESSLGGLRQDFQGAYLAWNELEKWSEQQVKSAHLQIAPELFREKIIEYRANTAAEQLCKNDVFGGIFAPISNQTKSTPAP